MKKKKSDICQNCGAQINDANYCHSCGQPNKEKILSLKFILGDFFSEYFTFDSKFIKSLFPLLFKPGRLTKEYVSGHRVSYILPLRLYLFTTFVFFFILAVNAKFDSESFAELDNETATISRDSLTSILDEKGDVLSPEVKNIIISNYDAAMAKKYGANESDKGLEFKYTGTDSTGWLHDYFNKKIEHLTSMGSEASRQFKKEMINQIPKLLFILLPVFALILKLLYVRRKRLYIEHLIFSLHFHTFVFIILLLPLFISHWTVFLIAFIAINLYLYFSLHNYYQDTYAKAFLKMILLAVTYAVAIGPAFALLVLFAVVSI